jgi:hypothetical protein
MKGFVYRLSLHIRRFGECCGLSFLVRFSLILKDYALEEL